MMRWLLSLLAVLLCSAALAGSPVLGPAAPLPCASLTDRSANPQGGAGRITLDTFVPDPGCWLRDISGEITNRGFMKLTATLAKWMVISGIVIGLIKSIVSASASAGIRAMILGVFCFSVVTGYGNKEGPGWLLATWAMGGWQQTYIASSSLGQTMLDASVMKSARDLDLKIADYIRISSALGQIQSDMASIADKTDPAALDQQYNDLVVNAKKDLTWTDGGGSFLGGKLSNYGFTYFLMLGLFSVFSAIILSSGIMVTLIVVALPILIGLLMLGHSTALRGAAVLWVSNLLTVLLLPVFLALLTGVILKAPVQALNETLTYNVQVGQKMVDETRTALNQCGGVLYVACNIKETLMSKISGYGQSLSDVFFGMGQVIFVLIVVFGIGLGQLRRIPSMVAQILGTVAGGESSGVRTALPGIPRMRMPQFSGGAPAAQSGARPVAVSRVGGGGGAGGPGRLGGGSGGGALGASVSPKMVLTKTITVQATRMLPKPPKP